MDIKILFDFVPKDRHVNKFFMALRQQKEVFNRFADLPDFTKFMYVNAGKNFTIKDACLLAIIEGIQYIDNKTPGLKLITYLLAPGLQNILMKSVSGGEDLKELWSTLSLEFFQSILHYPLINRPHKVAANLLLDTHHRIRIILGTQQEWRSRIEPIEGREMKADEEETIIDSRFASAFLEGEDDAGLNTIDLDLVISSRVYGESMKSLAKRLGLDYHNALKRRNRAEKHIRNYWRGKNDSE